MAHVCAVHGRERLCRHNVYAHRSHRVASCSVQVSRMAGPLRPHRRDVRHTPPLAAGHIRCSPWLGDVSEASSCLGLRTVCRPAVSIDTLVIACASAGASAHPPPPSPLLWSSGCVHMLVPLPVFRPACFGWPPFRSWSHTLLACKRMCVGLWVYGFLVGLWFRVVVPWGLLGARRLGCDVTGWRGFGCDSLPTLACVWIVVLAHHPRHTSQASPECLGHLIP